MAKHSVPNTLEHLRSEISLERDNSEIRDVLQVVVSNTTEMHTLLSMQSEEPLREVMETLQILYDAQLIEPVRSNFIRALWFLHEQTNRLPPLTDLTGQITFDVVDHILSGNTYSGEWLGTEKVELKAPRSLANTPDARKRFEREVGKWRHLKHDNIVSLYGIVFTGPDLFTAQPWFNRGTAINFVQKNPDVDRLKILNDIAAGKAHFTCQIKHRSECLQGLEYLHKENIIHGDLRGANVLIANNGSALLSGFGIVSFLEDDGNGIASSDTVNPRWSAPELLRNHGSTSKQSDVWSFAMVALELMTGQPPYSNTPRDITVLRELDQGKIPDHPGRAATLRGLSDGLWSFMRKCWHKRPDSRPLAAAANCRLRQLRGIEKDFFLPSSFHCRRDQPQRRFYSQFHITWARITVSC
ncbi:kinase-like domain-containing protein [Mycena leptocephala]|nr:kinase-like domain-containing protein [Mycena leptocephala]